MPSSFLKVGTSGWVYKHWEGIFYPHELKNQDKLWYFSKHFKTVEINYSFYHLPRPETYKRWYKITSKDFIFAVKVSRFITHIKRLKGVKEAWDVFLENASYLKEKLGPFLFQFPPSFNASKEHIKTLKNFLKLIRKKNYSSISDSAKLRFAFEFRHQSWYREEIYRLFKENNIALVIADSPNFPKSEKITANFVYVRMHGSKKLFSSKYTDTELKNLARKIKKWQKKHFEIFVYFNNDVKGFAILNAKKLLELCENRK